MSQDELKPCPFCGGEQVTTAPDREFGDVTWVVICKACGVRVERDLEEDAIAAWNTRPTAPVPDDVAGLVERRMQLLADLELELKGARVFIASREKMHPYGIDLYDETLAKVKAAIDGPDEAAQAILALQARNAELEALIEEAANCPEGFSPLGLLPVPYKELLDRNAALVEGLKPFAAIMISTDHEGVPEIAPNGYSDPREWRKHILSARHLLNEVKP